MIRLHPTILNSIVIFIIFSSSVMAQKVNNAVDFPVIFGKTDDNLPNKMKISGTIRDLTFAGTGCGVIAFAGTLKITLDKRIDNYPYDEVYVVNPCFGDFGAFGRKRKKYIGKKIEIEVSKLLEEYQYGQIKDIKKVPCAFDTITNDLNSNGITFYCTGYDISAAIKKYKN